MANQIPLSGATSAAGGAMLSTDQGRLLVKGVLNMTGAASLAGDSVVTRKRKQQFPIILGEPVADLVGEGAPKPVTGMEFDQTSLNIRKVATIVPFTDELLEDIEEEDVGTEEGEDLLAQVDFRVRRAIAKKIDELITGKQSGVNYTPTNGFDTMLRSTTATVELGTENDRLRRAVSAAMGILEDNGYDDPGQMGLLLGSDVRRHIRDARRASDNTDELYTDEDPFYGIQPAFSHNLNKLADSPAATKIVGFVCYRPNLHLRIRTDVRVKVSTDAVVNDGIQDRNAFQEDLTLLRFETRQGFMIHDLNRAVVAIIDAA